MTLSVASHAYTDLTKVRMSATDELDFQVGKSNQEIARAGIAVAQEPKLLLNRRADRSDHRRSLWRPDNSVEEISERPQRPN